MSDHQQSIRLRPHHFMCMHGFQGKGYSDLFVHHLSGMIDRLNDDPDQSVEIVHAVDDICMYCPHAKSDGSCDHDAKASVYDQKACDFFMIHESCMPFKEIKKRVYDHLSAEALKSICEDCQWLDLCLNSLKEEA